MATDLERAIGPDSARALTAMLGVKTWPREHFASAPMRVLALRPLREFWATHPQAQTSLKGWYNIALRADWTCFADLRKECPSADMVGKFVVFNIGGNKYRLVTAVHFNRRRVFVRHVLTHAEYDRGKWKEE